MKRPTVGQALHDLDVFHRKYGTLKELAPLFAAVGKVRAYQWRLLQARQLIRECGMQEKPARPKSKGRQIS